MSNVLAPAKKVRRRIRQVGVHKYQTVLPDSLWNELQQLAQENSTNVADLMRRFAKLGLLAAELEKSGASLIVRRDGQPDEYITVLI